MKSTYLTELHKKIFAGGEKRQKKEGGYKRKMRKIFIINDSFDIIFFSSLLYLITILIFTDFFIC